MFHLRCFRPNESGIGHRPKNGSSRRRTARRRTTPLAAERLESRSLLAALPAAGLVSWYRADGNALDFADGNHGALVNGAGFAPGLVGHAFQFDGVDDYVEVPTSDNLNFPAGGLTVEAWIYRTSAAPVEHIVGKREGCEGTVEFYQIAIAGSQSHGDVTNVPLNAWAPLRSRKHPDVP